MEENKDKRPKGATEDETIEFRREPEAFEVTRRVKPSDDMQNTAKIQGGAVIRPLKSQQNANRPANPPSQRPPQNGPRTVTPQSQRPVQQSRPAQPASPRPTQPANPRPAQSGPRTVKPQSSRPAQTSQPANPPSQRPALNAPQTIKPQTNRPAAPTPRPAQTQPQSGARNLPAPVPKNQPPVQKPVTPAPKPQPKRTENDDFEIDEATYAKRPRRRRAEQSAYADSATSAVMSLVKAVVYIVVIIAISISLAVFVIQTANDVFKFVGEDKIITVEIPEYATIDDIGDILGDAGIIKYPWAFKLWSNLKENPEKPPNFIAGTYEVSTMLNYDYLRSSFKKKTIREEVRITIPEGYTVDEIIDLFVNEYGIGTREGFIDAINNYDFDYRFLEELEVKDNRTYRLEGYLFPDTYYFYSDSSEVAVLNKLLDNFDKKFASEYYDRCTDLGMT
ncbi:MAG: hypothetical protein E7632_13000, partial [Ruminococcaceae bacterium]|nr:hypothetical protein [Oscillospiraceae bacterium]